ncbi:cell division protein SepF [Salisediminibacterium beveridgei]|uniref:Cell division protein SepF n=1 Tax=Salisediminibacterium beveridgei TaxID=632773 RepID=A0A1D7QW76_9BACI|nr:cell division protein SepF [Salisediminibacterium beveridgei]AOM83265.1 Cell division protein sepF [Salisediminibacterium beveridgei]
MTLKSKFKRFFELEDEYEERTVERELSQEENADLSGEWSGHDKKDKRNVVSLSSLQSQAKVILEEPHTYDEVQEIADHLKNRRAVVINLQRLPHDQAKRVVDFLSGTVYAIGGNIQKLGHNIFLCAPDNVDVTGNISEMLRE